MLRTGKEFGALNVRPWVTYRIGTSGAEIIQPTEQWVDAEGYTIGNHVFQVLKITQCSIVIETSKTADGPWNEIGTIDSSTPRSASSEYSLDYYLSKEEDALPEQKFDRFMRYRLVASATTAVVCFRWVAVFKKNGSAASAGGRVQGRTSKAGSTPRKLGR